MVRRPNFFIVGAPKCGTTAMDDYLSQHPDIFMARKEMHFFAPDMVSEERRKRDLDWYLAKFAGAGDVPVAGESSVFYLASGEAADRIRDFNANARILIHVRNPVDFLASHHSQVVYEGYEDIEDLREAYAAEPERRANRRIPSRCQSARVLYYREMASFADQIRRYFDAFGRDRVLVNVFDDFVKDTAGVYRRTLEFLEVDPAFVAEFKVINQNKKLRSRWVMDFTRNTPPWVTTMSRAILSKRARDRMKDRIGRWNTHYTPREPVDAAFRRSLQREFLPEVERLSALLDRDLTRWCTA